MKLPKILFVLPVRGAGGGANSVVQEALGLSRFGVSVGIAVNQGNHGKFIANYPELQSANVQVKGYPDQKTLATFFRGTDIVVATTNLSMWEVHQVQKLLGKGPVPRVAYYVQDYEPLFYAPDSDGWTKAYESYTLVSGAALFAKTRWLCDIVYENHGIQVEKVEPSIDHGIYYPDMSRWGGEQVTIVAMLRPKTPRRAPRRTARVLEVLANRYGHRVNLQIFGSDAIELAEHGITPSDRIANHGMLRRTQVPNLLRGTDMMLDLSDFQAFGRTAIESMACGCVPVVPVFGGTGEFARHGENSYVVDTRSDDAILEAVAHFIEMNEADRMRMRLAALDTANGYSIDRAALSELKLLLKMTSSGP